MKKKMNHAVNERQLCYFLFIQPYKGFDVNIFFNHHLCSVLVKFIVY